MSWFYGTDDGPGPEDPTLSSVRRGEKRTSAGELAERNSRRRRQHPSSPVGETWNLPLRSVLTRRRCDFLYGIRNAYGVRQRWAGLVGWTRAVYSGRHPRTELEHSCGIARLLRVDTSDSRVANAASRA